MNRYIDEQIKELLEGYEKRALSRKAIAVLSKFLNQF
jgi:hypothetical protein